MPGVFCLQMLMKKTFELKAADSLTVITRIVFLPNPSGNGFVGIVTPTVPTDREKVLIEIDEEPKGGCTGHWLQEPPPY